MLENNYMKRDLSSSRYHQKNIKGIFRVLYGCKLVEKGQLY